MQLRHRSVLAHVSLVVRRRCGGDEQANEPPQELEDTLGFGDEGTRASRPGWRTAIRDCMKAQGFEYVPVDPFAQQQALTGKARISDEEFTEQFGYGISTLFGEGNQQSDPNERITAAA